MGSPGRTPRDRRPTRPPADTTPIRPRHPNPITACRPVRTRNRSARWKPRVKPKPLRTLHNSSLRSRAARGTAQARPAADRQPELHDGAGVRGHDPAVVARPARDGRVVPGGHVVLAVLRLAASHRRLHVHVRRPVHRGGPAAPRRPGGLAGHPLRRRRRARCSSSSCRSPRT